MRKRKSVASSKPQDAILYLHVKPATKQWLLDLCKKQPNHVSQSTMIQRILSAAQKNPRAFTAA